MNEKALNLDELFGRSLDLTVVWDGARHTLLHPAAMGPEALFRLGRLQELRAEALEGGGEAEIVSAIDTLLAAVAPTLAAAEPPVPFLGKLRVLSFYQEQVMGEPDPNALAGGPSIGATSTPA